MSLFNKKKSVALALSISLSVIVSGAYAVQAETIPIVTNKTVTTASDIAYGFNAIFGDIPSRIMMRIGDAKINVHARAEDVAKYVARVSENISPQFLAKPNLSPLRMAIEYKPSRYTASALATVEPATSDEQAGPSVYESVRNFFGSAGRAVTDFFSSSPTVAPPVVVDVTESPAQPAVPTSSSQPAKSQPANSNSNAQRVVNNNSYPTYTTVVQGVSPDFMEKSLASLKADILASVNNTIRPISAQATNNAQTIQMVSRIEDLSNLIVRNGDFRNSIFDNGVRVSATGGNFTNLTGGTTSLGATTVTGDLSLTGSTTLQNFTFANATGTNATTTSLFATTASSTNLFTSNFSIASLSGFLKATAGSVATALINLASDITGVLPVANGGTGWAAVATGAIPYGNGSSALATTTAGTSGYVLALNGSTPTWVATTTLSNISGTLSVAKGGTGQTSFTADQIHYGDFATVATTTFTPSAEFTIGGTIGALIGGANSTLTIATNGIALTKLAQIAANTILGNTTGALGNATAIATSSLGIALSDTTGTLSVAKGGTGQTSFTADQIHYGDFATVATSSPTFNGGLTTSGTAGSLVGGSGFTVSLATINAGVLGAQTNSTVPTSQATSTLFGMGTGGQVIGWSNLTGGLAFIATSSSSGGITALGSGFASTTGTTITFSTTTLAFNGLTFGQTIVPTASALMFTPTLTGTLSVGGGGTGAATLTGLLQGNGAGAITAVTGTVGQFAYFNDTNTLTATSSIYLATSQYVGIGTTTPLSMLTIAGSASIGADYNIAGPTNGLIVQGSLGVGTTSPWLALSVTNTSASGQFVASYDDGNYATLAVDAVGDLKFTAKGGDIRALSENLWVCDNAGCPTLTATSTAGNVFIENAITFGNGFSMASTSNAAASELGLYNASGQMVIIFDDGL